MHKAVPILVVLCIEWGLNYLFSTSEQEILASAAKLHLFEARLRVLSARVLVARGCFDPLLSQAALSPDLFGQLSLQAAVGPNLSATTLPEGLPG